MCIQCSTGMSTRTLRRQLERVIQKSGWACQSVLAGKDPDSPNWVYTIGLEDLGRPEMIVIGYPAPESHAMLNDCAKRALGGDLQRPKPGEIIGHSCGCARRVAVVEVDLGVAAAGEWFNMALARRRGSDGFQALQLVWSDEFGQLPTVTTVEQPLLGESWWSSSFEIEN